MDSHVQARMLATPSGDHAGMAQKKALAGIPSGVVILFTCNLQLLELWARAVHKALNCRVQDLVWARPRPQYQVISRWGAGGRANSASSIPPTALQTSSRSCPVFKRERSAQSSHSVCPLR